MEKVFVAKCDEYKKEKIKRVIKKGFEVLNFNPKKFKKVLLKPNVLGAYPPERAVTTHPVFVEAVCEIFNGKIYVGDCSGVDHLTKRSLEKSGIKKAAKKCNAKLVNLNKMEHIKIVKKDFKYAKDLLFPKILFDVDLIVNLPKLKTHMLTLLSGGVKNLFGCVPGGQKRKLHAVANTERRFGEMLFEIYNIIKPKITIMDAIIGMEGNGPSAGTPKKTGYILISKNPAALDYVAAKIMGIDPYKIWSTKLIMEGKKVKIIGQFENKKYKMPFIRPRYIPRFISNLIFGRKPAINKRKCKKCMICVKNCPVGAIDENLNFKSNCIECFCCLELCPENAIYIKESKLKKLRFLFRKFV